MKITRTITVLAILLAMVVACSTQTGKTTRTERLYDIMVYEFEYKGMPCLLASTGLMERGGITCDWSKWEEVRQ